MHAIVTYLELGYGDGGERLAIVKVSLLRAASMSRGCRALMCHVKLSGASARAMYTTTPGMYVWPHQHTFRCAGMPAAGGACHSGFVCKTLGLSQSPLNPASRRECRTVFPPARGPANIAVGMPAACMLNLRRFKIL